MVAALLERCRQGQRLLDEERGQVNNFYPPEGLIQGGAQARMEIEKEF